MVCDSQARNVQMSMLKPLAFCGRQIFSISALYMAAHEQKCQMLGLEWFNLQADLLELALPKSPATRKLAILDRMSRSYSVFHD